MTFVDAARTIVGAPHVLIDAQDVAPFVTDWRGNYRGDAIAVVRPASTQEVAAIVTLAHQHNIAMVPQAGNTGLCGGSVPRANGGEVVINVSRMNKLHAIDLANDTVTVESGMILHTLQSIAREHDRLFALSLAAEGSCEIGGNIATNAGGTQVLRYGNMREQVLGLEAVLPDGRVWNGLTGLRKDNTGYDLKHLLIGSEGTLGIITAATLKLWPLPRSHAAAWVAMDDLGAAVRLLGGIKAIAGDRLTGFEVMSRACIDLVQRHSPGVQDPLSEVYSWYALVDLSDADAQAPLATLMERALAEALEGGVVRDAAIASNESQAAAMWHIREHVPEAQKILGTGIKHDISLPVSAIAQFVRETDALLQRAFAGIQLINFGHLGDGNLHYNCAMSTPAESRQLFARSDDVNTIVYDQVHKFDGSISAEHGIGQLKRGIIARYKSPIALDMMRAVKRALDPKGLMNPGKVL